MFAQVVYKLSEMCYDVHSHNERSRTVPKIVQHAVPAGEAKRGDMYNDVTIGSIKRGTSRVTFFDAEDQQFAYLRQTDIIRVARAEPTARERLDQELEQVEYYFNQYDETILRARSFDALTAFQEAITGRDGKQWTWASSFQVDDFIQRQAHAQFWAGLHLTEEFKDTPERPAQTTTDRLVILVELLNELRKRFLDQSRSHSTSQVSNLMDEAKLEAHRQALSDYFGGGLARFEWHLKHVRILEKAVRDEPEHVELVHAVNAAVRGNDIL
jgi:hypothetical protein